MRRFEDFREGVVVRRWVWGGVVVRRWVSRGVVVRRYASRGVVVRTRLNPTRRRQRKYGADG